MTPTSLGSEVASTPSRQAYRPDIEGMRSIAIGTVLAFHAQLPFVSGGYIGVDVFFVLSGFLITGLLMREVVETGRVDLARFWARRMRRLLPASCLVLAFSALVVWVALPVTQRSVFGGDIVASALYVVNWRLADRSVDYLAEDIGASPVQHFWSLAVEEQFYVIWPLLFVVVAIVARRRPVAGAFAALSAVTVVSFAYSVQQSAVSGPTAFFVSTTRIWELGVGALLALSARRVAKLPPTVRACIGWIGLASVVTAALLYEESTQWPGLAALLPVLGTAAVVAGGIAPARGAPTALLSLRPLVWVGGLSYSLYLWHWPTLVAGEALAGGHLRIRYAVLLVVVSFVPAWLCHRFVENPIRFGPRFRATRRSLRLGLTLTTVSVLVGLSLPSGVLNASPHEASARDATGAEALLSDPDKDWARVDRVDSIRPLPAAAPEDLPSTYTDRAECRGFEPQPTMCLWGDRSATKTVVVVGDSKINQWQDALDRLAKKQHWRYVQITRSACAFTAAPYVHLGEPWTSCQIWGQNALEKILEIDPDLVVTSQRNSTALPPGKTEVDDETSEAMAQGLVAYWSELTAAGIPVAVLLDNPSPGQQVYECVAKHPTSLSRCTFDRAAGIASSAAPTQRAAAARVRGVTVMDLTDAVCPPRERCPAVIGNVLVYRQGSHITNTYALSAQSQLSTALYHASGGQIGTRD